MEAGTYKIRPVGRHLLTIGRDLIQDFYAAVVELVKNSFDADATRADIKFYADVEKGQFSTTVPKEVFSEEYGDALQQNSSPFVKDIIARFSSYYARQGQPDIFIPWLMILLWVRHE